MSFSRIYNQAAARKGGEVELRAILPRVAAPGELEAMADDRYLSEVTRCVFKAGFVWIGLLMWFKRHGARLGGNTAQYFLRRVGWDGFILSSDVAAGLYREERLDASPGSKKALMQAQQAFNDWHKETGLPYSHLSRILSYSVGD